LVYFAIDILKGFCWGEVFFLLTDNGFL